MTRPHDDPEPMEGQMDVWECIDEATIQKRQALDEQHLRDVKDARKPERTLTAKQVVSRKLRKDS
jgi:hypothetical protein